MQDCQKNIACLCHKEAGTAATLPQEVCMTGLYVLIAICIALALACVALCVLLLKKGGAKIDDSALNGIREENERLKNDVDTAMKINNSMMLGALNAQTDNIRAVGERMDRFMQITQKGLEEVKTSTAQSIANMRVANEQSIASLTALNANSIKEMKDDNAKQLEKMRETVDEKLSATLETRFNQSFKIVNDRLEEINRTFSELQNLQTGVNDLNRIFKNVKTRGTWGEVSLESLLAQILAPEQYQKQVRIKRGSEDMVDFVIRMPGKGDEEVFLPIDAKFPIEDYARLVEASEKGDPDGVEAASKALANRVKSEAMSIRDKYVNPPKTTDFAIMYLPTEGLYAEIIRREGLVEDIQNKFRIVVCGPTTIAALLNSLQMGFRSVAIEKRSTEIGKLLQGFMSDFALFTKYLKQTGDRLDTVKKSLENAEERTRIIGKKLNKVNSLSDDKGPDMEQLIAASGNEEITFEDVDNEG